MKQQYTFHFLETNAPSISTDTFIESEINADAVKWVQSWPDRFLSQNSVAHVIFPHAMMICGPSGCGKTHLAKQWASRVQAQFINVQDIDVLLESQPKRQQYYVVENIHNVVDETILFHFFNHIKEFESYVVFTSHLMPSALPFSLADLRSRLNAIPIITISEPDDELLFRITHKFFHDRQLQVDDEVIQYLLCRIDRSIRSVKNIVSKLDSKSLIEQRAITIPFVKDVLSCNEPVSINSASTLWASSN